MLEKYCDILVIGNELPGLVTAAFLARRGLSVQVVDSDLFLDHPKMPDPVCLTNIHSKLLRSILGRLNCPEITIQNFLNRDAILQFIFPHHRIDICNDPLNYYEEIEREFGRFKNKMRFFYEEQTKLRHQTDTNELFQKLIPSSWKERRQFKKFVEEQSLDNKSADFNELTSLSPRIKSFLKAQYLLAYQQVSAEPFACQISELLNPGDGEIFGVYPGVNVLKNILKDRITQYDGFVKKKIQISELLFRNGIVEGIQLDDRCILSKYVIWNSSLLKLAELLPQKLRFRRLKKICQKSSFDFHWFTTRFSVDKKFIPHPMKSNVVLINDSHKELVDDNFLYLQILDKKNDPRCLINVNFLLPPSALNEEEDFFIPYIDSFKKQLVQLLPFCEKSLSLEFPTKNLNQPLDTLFPLNENDFEIFKHSARQNGVAVQAEEKFTELFDLHYKTKAPNFYISHPKIFTSFGLESKLVLGLKITDLIWQEVEKDKKRAMKSERRIA
ncbi:MAG: hypothetical protein HQM16_00985 [Deltaproteobacteria bacterium]|nr:hypothetical protein [Deltaproteobacteria bacterium]